MRTVRAELLDLVLVIGRRQLLSVLKQYEHHYNSHRLHRSIDLHAPESVGSDAAVVPLRQITDQGRRRSHQRVFQGSSMMNPSVSDPYTDSSSSSATDALVEKCLAEPFCRKRKPSSITRAFLARTSSETISPIR